MLKKERSKTKLQIMFKEVSKERRDLRRRSILENYMAKVNRYKRLCMPVPSLGVIARSMGVSSPDLRNVLKRAGMNHNNDIKYTSISCVEVSV